MPLKIERGHKKPDKKYAELDKMKVGEFVVVKSMAERQRVAQAMRYRGYTVSRNKNEDGDGWEVWRDA